MLSTIHDSMGRVRGSYTLNAARNDVVFTGRENGLFIRSNVADGRHAPVFVAEADVTAVPTATGTDLIVTAPTVGQMKALRRGLRTLRRHGWIAAADAKQLRRQLRALLGSTGRLQTASVRIPLLGVHARVTRNGGAFASVVYLDHAMTLRQSLKLVEATGLGSYAAAEARHRGAWEAPIG